MQEELEAAHPELDIQIIGINEHGQQIGNASITQGRDIPWLQDVDANGDRLSDVWRNSWDIVYRDVVILDDENVVVGVMNLTSNDLADPVNYGALRDMLIDTAMAARVPDLEAGDANGDYRFDQLDLFQVLRAAKYDTGQPATWQEGDWNGDGAFDRLDIVAALASGNYLKGPYAAMDAAPGGDDVGTAGLF